MTIEELKQIYDPSVKCPIIYTMDILGSKWKMPIIWQLTLEDGLHYNELKRRVNGVTNTMLTRSLRDLENEKIIERHSLGSVPPSVTYHLTNIGKELLPALEGLFAWGNKHMEQREENEENLLYEADIR